MKKFFKNWSKKQKMFVGTACVAGVLGFAWVSLSGSVEPKQVSLKVEEKETKEAAYSKKVSSLVNDVYADKTMEILSPTFDQKKSIQVKEVLTDAPKGTKSKELKENENQLTNALHMFTVVTELNNAYETEGIVKSDAKLKDTEGLLVLLKESKPKFYANQEKRATEAKNQIVAIADTTKAVYGLFTDQTKKVVKDDVTKESYTPVVAKVNGLKQVSLKESLSASLTLVEAKVSEKELAVAAVEAEKVAQEEAVAVEAAQVEQANQNQAGTTQNGTSGTNESNNTTNSNGNGGGDSSPSYEQPSGGGGGQVAPTPSQPTQPTQPSQPSQPTQPSQPSQPTQPTGPPAGWITPPYPIGSGELVDWLADQGYSGYWSSGGYIQPY